MQTADGVVPGPVAGHRFLTQDELRRAALHSIGGVPDEIQALEDDEDEGIVPVIPHFKIRGPSDSLAHGAQSVLRGHVPYGMARDLAGWAGNNYIDKTSSLASARVLKDEDCNLVSIVRALDSETSRAWRDWEPETIFEHVGIGSDVLKRDKIMAAQTIVTNPDVFEDWALFTAVSSVANHRRANFEWFDAPTYLEAAWTCEIMRRLAPARSFGPGLIRFLVALMIEEGLYFFPWVGGEGLALSDGAAKTANGIARIDAEMCGRLRRLWEDGGIKKVRSGGDIDEHDVFEVQLAKLVAGQEYIRLQKSDDPGAYKASKKNENEKG